VTKLNNKIKIAFFGKEIQSPELTWLMNLPGIRVIKENGWDGMGGVNIKFYLTPLSTCRQVKAVSKAIFK